MALGALDGRHVAGRLRHFCSRRGHADHHRSFSHSTRRGRPHWSELGVWCCHWRGVGGPMADHLGRKKLMLADMMIIAAGALISGLANGPAMLFIGQLLVGIGVGIDFPVSSSYVS